MNESMTEIQYRHSKAIDMTSLKKNVSWRHKKVNENKSAATGLSFIGVRDKCPICQCAEMIHFAEIFGFNYVECTGCGHLYYLEIVRNESIHEIYAGDTEYLRHFTQKDIYESRVEFIARPKVKFVSDIIPHALGDEWVDLGCGACDILYAAREKGWKVRGVEPGRRGVEVGRYFGINVSQEFVTPENIPEIIAGSRVVSLINVIEHLFDPLPVMQAIGKSLTPDAWFVCEVPRHPSLSSLSCKLQSESVVRHIVPPEHIHIFTEKSITTLLKMSGLIPTNIWRFGQDFYEIMTAVTMMSKYDINSWPKELFDSMNAVQGVLDEHGLSDCLFLIARKR